MLALQPLFGPNPVTLSLPNAHISSLLLLLLFFNFKTKIQKLFFNSGDVARITTFKLRVVILGSFLGRRLNISCNIEYERLDMLVGV